MGGREMTQWDNLFAFLKALKENNNREWFAAHRSEYDNARTWWHQELQKLIAIFAQTDPRFRYLEAEQCCYRIYRDTRFSPDKSPYKTYFGAVIAPRGRHCDGACHYIHIGADDCSLNSGLWVCESAILKKIRKAIVDNVEEFRSITETDNIQREFPQWWGPTLKTAPKGYDRNHPDIDLLRLTQFVKTTQVSPDYFKNPDWQHDAAAKLQLLDPMNEFLNYSLTE